MIDYNKDTAMGYKEKDVVQAYKNAYTNKLSISNFDAKLVAKHEIKSIEKLIKKISPLDLILDIPCGTGKLAKTLLTSGKVIAADISESMIELARNDYEEHDNFVEFMCADATNLDFKDNMFNCIVCLRLMQRVPHEIRKSMLNEYNRTSKKYLIISYGYTSLFHDIRIKMLTKINGRNPIPCATKICDIESELKSCGWIIKDKKLVLPLLSSEIIYLCEKEYSIPLDKMELIV